MQGRTEQLTNSFWFTPPQGIPNLTTQEASPTPGSYYDQSASNGTRQFSQTGQTYDRSWDARRQGPPETLAPIPEIDDEGYRLTTVALGRIEEERRRLARHDQRLAQIATGLAAELSQIRLHYSSSPAPQAAAPRYDDDPDWAENQFHDLLRGGGLMAGGARNNRQLDHPAAARGQAEVVPPRTALRQEPSEPQAAALDPRYYGQGSKVYEKRLASLRDEPGADQAERGRDRRQEAAAPAIGQRAVTAAGASGRHRFEKPARQTPGRFRRLIGRAACLLVSITPGATVVGVGLFAHF